MENQPTSEDPARGREPGRVAGGPKEREGDRVADLCDRAGVRGGAGGPRQVERVGALDRLVRAAGDVHRPEHPERDGVGPGGDHEGGDGGEGRGESGEGPGGTGSAGSPPRTERS